MRDKANAVAVKRMLDADPVLVDVRPVLEVVPGFSPNTVLTSGAPMPWEAYEGGQRNAIIGGVLMEGLARDPIEADEKIRSGEVRLATCYEYGCIGSVTGIYTASMPVFVVEDTAHGNRAYCTPYEGPIPDKITYGVYNEAVRENWVFLRDVICRTLGEAVRGSGGVPLLPLMRRAVHMGDDLHSRNTAGSVLFLRELFPYLLDSSGRREDVRATLEYFKQSDYFFLRLVMAAAKTAADAAHGIEGSSLVTGIVSSWKEMAIRVSGLGDQWFRAPVPTGQVRLFEGYTEEDAAPMGGESTIAETIGLGAFAQAAAFPLQAYSSGTPEAMVENNLLLYRITLAEHPHFHIPYLRFRGTPAGIDIFKVVETGIEPMVHAGIAHKDGGQIGAGILRVPLACFEQAVTAFEAQYGTQAVASSSS